MKNVLLLLFFLGLFSNCIFAQYSHAFGIEGTVNYTFQTQPPDSVGYHGQLGYGIGASGSKSIGRTNIWVHSGLYITKFADKNYKTVGVSNQLVSTENKYSTHAFSIPLSVKIFLADRSCHLFIQPAVDLQFFVFEQIKNTTTSRSQGEQINRSSNLLGDAFSMAVVGSLSFGGQTPITKDIDILLQLRASAGLWGTGVFKESRPLSLGIRTGILKYF